MGRTDAAEEGGELGGLLRRRWKVSGVCKGERGFYSSESHGGVAHMVERLISIQEARGSIPCTSNFFVFEAKRLYLNVQTAMRAGRAVFWGSLAAKFTDQHPSLRADTILAQIAFSLQNVSDSARHDKLRAAQGFVVSNRSNMSGMVPHHGGRDRRDVLSWVGVRSFSKRYRRQSHKR